MGLEDRVSAIIVEQLGVTKEELAPGASFIDDLGADSLDIVELVMAMEEEFDRDSRRRCGEDPDHRRCDQLREGKVRGLTRCPAPPPVDGLSSRVSVA